MQIRNEPAAYGFLAGLSVLLFAALALATGCATNAAAMPGGGRSPQTAMDSVVLIRITCTAADGGGYAGYGSGVIVNDHTLITAAHVAVDDPGETCIRTATMANGETFMVVLGTARPDRDLATLVTVLGTFAPTYPVVFGPVPAFGSRVCSMTAYPKVLWRCGEMQTEADPPGDKYHTIVTEGGNSGSGVYDAQGRLVGIITHRWSCSNNQYCGGKLSTLAGYIDELMK